MQVVQGVFFIFCRIHSSLFLNIDSLKSCLCFFFCRLCCDAVMEECPFSVQGHSSGACKSVMRTRGLAIQKSHVRSADHRDSNNCSTQTSCNKTHSQHWSSVLVFGFVVYEALLVLTVTDWPLAVSCVPQAWLQRYGYLPPTDPRMSVLRSAQSMQSAIAAMQRLYGLNVTGALDKNTIEWVAESTPVARHPASAVPAPIHSPHPLPHAAPDSCANAEKFECRKHGLSHTISFE